MRLNTNKKAQLSGLLELEYLVALVVARAYLGRLVGLQHMTTVVNIMRLTVLDISGVHPTHQQYAMISPMGVTWGDNSIAKC